MSNIHMIPTQKTWDAAVNGELNGLTIMGDGELVEPERPKSAFFLEMYEMTKAINESNPLLVRLFDE